VYAIWTAIVHPTGEGGQPILLALRPPQTPISLSEANRIFHRTPSKRTLGVGLLSLQVVIKAMTPDYSTREKEAAIRWIVGIDPVIVAIGIDKTSYLNPTDIDVFDHFQLPQTFRLISKDDLPRKAVKLFVLPFWPSEMENEYINENLGKKITDRTLEIDLGQERSLEEILQMAPSQLQKLMADRDIHRP
jgi:hypothetical protein